MKCIWHNLFLTSSHCKLTKRFRRHSSKRHANRQQKTTLLMVQLWGGVMTPPSNTKSRMQTPTMRRIVAMMNRLRVRTSGRQAIKNKRLKSIHYLLAIAIFCLLSRFFATNRDSCLVLGSESRNLNRIRITKKFWKIFQDSESEQDSESQEFS